MKRLPLLFSLLAVIALSASIAYWVMQLYKPAQRPLTATAPQSLAEPSPDAASTLFGGQAVALVATNYQLTGVVSAGRESVAILVADGQPPKALPVGKELAAGVTVSEVHPRYVMLSEGGVLKRIELATDAKAGTSLSPPLPQGGMPNYQQNQNQPNQPNQQFQNYQQAQPNQQVPVPGNPPQEMPQPQPQGVPPPPPSVQMPTPTRTFNPGAVPPNQ